MRHRKKILICFMLCWMLSGMFSPAGNIISASSADKETLEYVSSQKKLIQAVHDRMANWESKFTIAYQGNWKKIFPDSLDELIDQVMQIDNKNTSDDYDYLKGSVKKYSVEISGNSTSSTFIFHITYLETSNQHNSVNTFVKNTLSNLKLTGKSDYAKIRTIHNYIVNRVTYDESGNNFSAYSAAIKKSSVCQGYALLFYKMATEAGISTRYVTSSNHAWNIVKLGSKWYHVDTTWDDPVSSKPMLTYDYFLKGSETMAGSHVLSSEFTTSAFQAAYPVSEEDYQK